MKQRRIHLAATAVVASLTLALSACGGAPNNPPAPIGETSSEGVLDVPRDQIKDGGKLVTPMTEITPQFNTFQADGSLYTRLVWEWYNPVMMTFSKDGEWKANPDYLTDVKEETVDGKTKITYTINPKAVFNDGTPIDWRAFDTVWKTNSGKDERFLQSSTDGYERIASVEKGADDRQAVVTFEGAWAWWQGLFNYVEHPALADPEVFNKGYIDKPNEQYGAGPYTIDTYDKQNQTVSFKRNDKWWGDPGKLDSRVMRGMESSAQLNAFKNGEIDAASSTTAEQLKQLEGVPDTERRSASATSVALLQINPKSEKLSDIKVRQAIATGIDREQIKNVVFQGTGYTEQPMGSLSLLPYQKGYADNFAQVVPKPDPEKSGQLLDEAGWAKGPDGIREKGGQKLTLVFPNLTDTATGKARAQALQAQMKAIGVDMQVQQRPSSDFSAVWTKKEFDLFMMGFSQSDPYGMAYFGQVWNTDGSLNVGDGSPEFDKKIAEMGAIADTDAQIARGNELEVEALQNFGKVPMYMGPDIITVKKGIVNGERLTGGNGATQFYIARPQDTGWLK
ncbi:ABC transporter family substrate-binding protein [Enemella evansiae]|uniref:ABC transporter family substrate-binding protein n=1 Tax=Enemella evansiae TaxID=2016499 RepID=UPI000B962DE6|nr:ABC transporter family substrate-binding protein [Enemella evansiae]OYO01974.1 ABC transporter substrate-binding protein [Enemella evansiae]